MKLVSELYGCHEGQDIYVVGTGTSLRVFPHSFLQDKITIGLNMAWKVFPVKYAITIHPDLNVPEFIPGESPQPEIIWICGRFGKTLIKGVTEPENIKYATESFYFFSYWGQSNTQPPNQPSDSGRVLEWLKKPTDDYLYVWSSISQTAVNLAANMGAKNVILVGCDNCSLLDNHHTHYQHTRWKGVDPNQRYRQYYEGLAEVRAVLRKRDVNVVSLSPFLSLANPEEDFKLLCEELKRPELIKGFDISSVISSPQLNQSGNSILKLLKSFRSKIRSKTKIRSKI